MQYTCMRSGLFAAGAPAYGVADFPVDAAGVTAALGRENKNSSGDEIANVNFYAVRPEGTRIR